MITGRSQTVSDDFVYSKTPERNKLSAKVKTRERNVLTERDES